MTKIVEGLADADLITPTLSGCVVLSTLVLKKDGTFRLVVDHRGLNEQIEKTCSLRPNVNDVNHSLGAISFFLTISLTSAFFAMV